VPPLQFPLDRALLARQAASARNLGWATVLESLRDNFHWLLLLGVCSGATALAAANERRRQAAEEAAVVPQQTLQVWVQTVADRVGERFAPIVAPSGDSASSDAFRRWNEARQQHRVC
jgi:hypothetical protein